MVRDVDLFKSDLFAAADDVLHDRFHVIAQMAARLRIDRQAHERACLRRLVVDRRGDDRAADECVARLPARRALSVRLIIGRSRVDRMPGVTIVSVGKRGRKIFSSCGDATTSSPALRKRRHFFHLTFHRRLTPISSNDALPRLVSTVTATTSGAGLF
jgi:hypothetical protein